MHKLGLEDLTKRLKLLILDLREHEVIEIKQKGYVKGEISVTVKNTTKEEFNIEEK